MDRILRATQANSDQIQSSKKTICDNCHLFLNTGRLTEINDRKQSSRQPQTILGPPGQNISNSQYDKKPMSTLCVLYLIKSDMNCANAPSIPRSPRYLVNSSLMRLGRPSYFKPHQYRHRIYKKTRKHLDQHPQHAVSSQLRWYLQLQVFRFLCTIS